MDVSQQFIPVGSPIGLTASGEPIFANDALIRFHLSLFNRTGQEPGTTPDDIAGQAAFEAMLLQRPQRADLTDAFLFAVIMLGARVTALSANQNSSLVTASITASETITAPALVNIWSNSGAFNVRNADGSTTGKDCQGYVTKSVSSGGTAVVAFSGVLQGLSGLTPGYAYLGAGAGLVTSTPLTTVGQTSQRVGIAVSATAINFAPQDSVQL